jgi:hypothetical protein
MDDERDSAMKPEEDLKGQEGNLIRSSLEHTCSIKVISSLTSRPGFGDPVMFYESWILASPDMVFSDSSKLEQTTEDT